MPEQFENPDAMRALNARLVQCFRRAWSRFMAMDPAAMASWSPRTKASVLHDYLTAEVEVEFADDPEVQYAVSRGLRHLVTPFARIRFKKVDRALRVAGNPTRQSEQWVQAGLPHVPSTPVSLHFGYRPDKLWSSIQLLALVRQVGRHVTWFHELELVETATELIEQPVSMTKPRLRLKPGAVEGRQAEFNEQLDRVTSDGAGK